MFGGNPGLVEYKSALHASHGFAAFALAYFGTGHLPRNFRSKLDLEYFEKAVQYLKNHKNVLGENGIGVYAICKGAQIAIMMATYLEDIRCIVSVNGVCAGGMGSFKYKDMSFDYDEFKEESLDRDTSKDVSLADSFDTAPVDMEKYPSFFPFHKRHHVSYMLVAGLADTCMPTRILIGEMERLLHKEKHPDFEILKYTDTGHLIEPPNLPFMPVYYQPGKGFDLYLTSGGKLTPHCKSQIDHWPKALDFLKKRLLSNEPLPAASKL